MADGISVTVLWTIKPDCVERFVEALRGMFPETRTHKGFRTIQLIPSASDATSFLLLEEWDEAEDFDAYGRFRVQTGDTARLLDMTVSYPQLHIWSGSPIAEAMA